MFAVMLMLQILWRLLESLGNTITSGLLASAAALTPAYIVRGVSLSGLGLEILPWWFAPITALLPLLIVCVCVGGGGSWGTHGTL